jgi:hypothetical protein
LEVKLLEGLGMQFQISFLKDLEDDFEDIESFFIEASSWAHALQQAEAKAVKLKKHLSGIDLLSLKD